MTVDDDYISAVSRGKYTVGDTGIETITDTTFDIFLDLAVDQISQDFPNGGYTTNQYDFLQALLVCHYIELDSVDKISESMDNYSYSRKSTGSAWLTQYQDMTNRINTGTGTAYLKSNSSDGVTRVDSDALTAMGYSK